MSRALTRNPLHAERPARRFGRTDGGFTLVESLVALAVFATVGVGLISLQAQSVRTFGALETRTFASIVAQNILTDAAAAATPPELGQREGVTEMAGKSWAWRIEVTNTLEPEIRRVRVTVREPLQNAVGADMNAFIATPGGV